MPTNNPIDWTPTDAGYVATRGGHTYTCTGRHVRVSDGEGCVTWGVAWTLRRDDVVVSRQAPDPTRARSYALHG